MQTLLMKTDGEMKSGMTDKALLIVRLAAGFIFVLHGYGKLTGNPSLEMFSGMLAHMGVPASMFFAWVVALVEFLGGIGLILGLFTRPAGILLAIDMLVAMTMAKHLAFPAADPDLALFAISVALALTGAGRWSVAAMMMKKK
jgi:putative oxidoreductase